MSINLIILASVNVWTKRLTRRGTLSEIEIDDGDRFSFEGLLVDINVYGELTHQGIYFDASNLTSLLGFSQIGQLPKRVDVVSVYVDGVLRQALTYIDTVVLVAARSDKTAIARHLISWILHLLHPVHGSIQGWQDHGRGEATSEYHVIYVIEVGNMLDFQHYFRPPIVPSNWYPHTSKLFKIGCGDIRVRIKEVIADLMSVFLGSNPKLVAVARFPGSSRVKLIGAYEGRIHNLCKDRHLRGATIHGGEYTELFCLDKTRLELVRSNLLDMEDINWRDRISLTRICVEHARRELTRAETRYDQVRAQYNEYVLAKRVGSMSLV